MSKFSLGLRPSLTLALLAFSSFALRASEQPSFPGGLDSLTRWMKTTMVYPRSAQAEGVEGRATILFYVEPDGSLSDIEVLRSSGDARLDAEAMRVVRKMPHWLPGEEDGSSARMPVFLPFKFRLSRDTDREARAQVVDTWDGSRTTSVVTNIDSLDIFTYWSRNPKRSLSPLTLVRSYFWKTSGNLPLAHYWCDALVGNAVVDPSVPGYTLMRRLRPGESFVYLMPDVSSFEEWTALSIRIAYCTREQLGDASGLGDAPIPPSLLFSGDTVVLHYADLAPLCTYQYETIFE